MAVNTLTDQQQSAPTSLRKNSTGFIGVAFFVVAAAAPMAGFVGASPVVFSMLGPAVPLVYVLVSLVIAIFAVGYLKMSKHITNAGGLVAYIARGLGPRMATAAAGLVVITYIALLVGLWAQYAVFAQQLMHAIGLNLPVWAWILITLVATTVLTMRGIDVNLRVLAVLITLEILVIVVFVVGVLAHSAGKDLSLVSFNPTHLANPSLGLAVLFVVTCFTTFEATAVFAEEARDPRRTIPRALYSVIAFVGIFFTIATWAVSVGLGASHVQAKSAADLAGVIFGLADASVGPWLGVAMQVLVVTSFIAMLIGVQNMFARYVFALGRAGVLPRQLAVVSRKRQTPAPAALVIGILLAVVLMAFLWAGADPIVVVYSWFLALGTVGWVLILMLASIGIVVFFLRDRLETGLWSTRVAPIASVVLTAAIVYLAISNYDSLLSGPSIIAKLLLLLLPAAFFGGLILAQVKKDIDFAIVAISS